MKQILLTLTISLFLSLPSAYAAACTDAWNTQQDQIYTRWVTDTAGCGNPWTDPNYDDCTDSADTSFNISSAINNIVLVACCYSAPLNC